MTFSSLANCFEWKKTKVFDEIKNMLVVIYIRKYFISGLKKFKKKGIKFEEHNVRQLRKEFLK